MSVKVFLSGEGKNEIGSRWYDPRNGAPGVIEVLLSRVRPDGWHVDRARQWKSIRKFRVGSGQGQAEHADAHNVRGLVLEAYESASRMLAFIRDADDEAERVDAIRRALDTLDALGFSDAFGYQLEVVGGTVAPTLESWILCLHGRYKHADMSVSRAASAITTAGIELKSTAAYVAIADTGALPTHDCSLKRWLDQAREAFARLIDGAPR